jgi:hypothetical protein
MLMKSNSDTGEHISNEKNELEYIPFPVCNETGKPLELQYGVEDGMRSSLRQPVWNTFVCKLQQSRTSSRMLPPAG